MKSIGTYIHKYLGKIEITEEYIDKNLDTSKLIYVISDRELHLVYEQDIL